MSEALTPMLTSRHHPLVRLVHQLRLKKHRAESGLFFCEGVRVVDELLKSQWPIEQLLVTEHQAGRFRDRARARGAPVTVISDPLAEYLAQAESSQGVLAVARPQQLPLPERTSLLVVADRIADPGNVGTMLRSATAFGADGVVLLGPCADLFGAKTIRASAGSLFHLPVIHCDTDEELVAVIASLGLRLAVAVARNGSAPWEADLSDTVALVFGHETRGVSPTLLAAADVRLTLPLHPRSESLNVAAAAAAVLGEVVRQRGGG